MSANAVGMLYYYVFLCFLLKTFKLLFQSFSILTFLCRKLLETAKEIAYSKHNIPSVVIKIWTTVFIPPLKVNKDQGIPTTLMGL